MVFFPKIKFSQATHFFEEAKSAETPQTPTFKVLPAEPTHDAIQITKKVFQQPIVTKKIQRPALPLLPQGLNRSLKNLIKTDELEDQARASFASGQFQQAAQLWQQVLASDPNNQKAQEGLKSLQQISAIPSAAPSNPPQGDV
ncbi:MAG: hypothetical protein IPJ69_09635 [Deltaproteobacteria bacterium]|nr:MAG: hypothetical protein IPJ69_09635 [Deltaproteobacteria bacterium]